MSTAKKKKASGKRAAKAGFESPAFTPAPPAANGAWRLKLLLVLLLIAGVWGAFGKFRSSRTLDIAFEKSLANRGLEVCQVLGSRHLAVDAEGNVAWVYGGGREIVLQTFDKTGKCLAKYKARNATETLENVYALAYAADGSLWAAERGTARLVHLSAGLKFLGSIATGLKDVSGVAVDPQGQIWATGLEAKAKVFSPKGELIREFLGAEKAPLKIAYRLAFNPDGEMAVIDGYRGNDQDLELRIYDAQGEKKASVAVKDVKFNLAACIAWDPTGYWVLNLGGIRLFDRQGKQVATAQAIDHSDLRQVPSLAIGAKGEWALDLTPLGRGAELYRLVGQE